MARPKKDTIDLRVFQTNIRLTEPEFRFAKEQAKLLNLSIANWLRKSAFSKRALTVTVTPMHRAYYKQMVGLSNNLNQIAKRVNSNQYTKIHEEILEIKKLLQTLNSLFNDSQTN